MNLWILFITFPLCLRSSTGMLSMPGALLFNFCVAGWVSLLVLVFPFSHSVCAFGSVLCLVLLFDIGVYFHLVAPRSALFHFPLLCFLLQLIPFYVFTQICIGLFPFLPSYMPVFGSFP